MSDSEEQRADANVDALAAMAAGRDQSAAHTDHLSEAEETQEEADALADAAAGAAADNEAVLAAAEQAEPMDPETALAAAAAEELDPAAALAAAVGAEAPTGSAAAFAGAPPALGGPAAAERKRARSLQMQMQSRRVHAYQFKRFMIPMLIVVGVLVLIMGVATLVLVPSDPNAPIDDQGNPVDGAYEEAPQENLIPPQFRPWLILSAFVVGPILLLGAWMFHADVRRSDKREAAQRGKMTAASSAANSRPGRPPTP